MSKKESASCTAMVSAYVYGKNESENLRIYILPNPINKRGMEFSEMLERMKELSRNLGGGSHLSKIFIEEVALQAAPQIQTLENEGYPIEGIRPGSTDKRTRLMTVSNLVQTGKVLFPRNGAETLIQQIVFFSLERYDDLADAFSMLLGQIMVEENKPRVSITWIGKSGPPRRLLMDENEDG
jgi:predicted phage terminase large subunit-like protein